MRVKTVINEAEARLGCTWDHLVGKYGQDRDHWTQAFRRKPHYRSDLVRMIDRNSGYKPREPYAESLVRTLDQNDELGWALLENMFDRTEKQLRDTLYSEGRKDLVKGRER